MITKLDAMAGLHCCRAGPNVGAFIKRKSELSGDRAGLLCAQDIDVALRVELKLAGGARLDKLDPQASLAQAREYEQTGDMRDGLLKLLNLELQTHPFSVLRAAALTKWVDTGGYGAIIPATIRCAPTTTRAPGATTSPLRHGITRTASTSPMIR